MSIEEKKMKKVNKLLTGLLIGIVILMIILVILFIYYVKDNDKDKNLVNESNKETVQSNIVEVPLDSLEAAEFVEAYNNIIPVSYDQCGYADLGLYYHKTDKLLAENMDNRLKMDLAFSLIKNNSYYEELRTSENSNGDYQIPEKSLESAYHALFGNESKYTFTEVKSSCPNIYKESPSSDYSLATGNIYIATQCGRYCGMPYFSQNIIKLEKSVDQKEIYIYEEVAYLGYEYDEASKKDYNLYYKDPEKKILIGNSKEETYEEISNKNQMSVYKYTFKYQPRDIEKTDNGISYNGFYGIDLADWTSYRDYYFYSVEKVK